MKLHKSAVQLNAASICIYYSTPLLKYLLQCMLHLHGWKTRPLRKFNTTLGGYMYTTSVGTVSRYLRHPACRALCSLTVPTSYLLHVCS